MPCKSASGKSNSRDPEFGNIVSAGFTPVLAKHSNTGVTGLIVGKQEVKQSARVRADYSDYYISCAFGLRSVGFVCEGTPEAKVH